MHLADDAERETGRGDEVVGADPGASSKIAITQ